jgi:hypothetical protein
MRVGPRREVVMLAASALVMACASLDAQPVPVERLTIRYREGNFELVSSTTTTMALPPMDVARDHGRARSGFWYEHYDSGGKLRYRRVMRNPVLLVFEEAGAPGSTGMVRHEAVPTERVFTILIPAAKDREVVSLFSSPIRLGAEGEPAGRVAQFTLRRRPVPDR